MKTDAELITKARAYTRDEPRTTQGIRLNKEEGAARDALCEHYGKLYKSDKTKLACTELVRFLILKALQDIAE